MGKIKSFLILSKPRLVYLLFFTGFTAMIIAGSLYGYDWLKIILLSIAIILGVMGSNAMTNFVDRRIDRIMERTRDRPIPAGRLTPKQALVFALIMVAAGTILAGYINIWSGLIIIIGFIDSAIIYNAISKRKTPLNILMGAPAGGMPVLAGWIGITGRFELLPILLFILILIWTPVHIWSLAYFYREDYKKAGVPMLPVIIGARQVFLILAILDILMVAFSVFIGVRYSLGPIYLAGSGLFGAVVAVYSILLVVRGRDRTAWILFKLTSPYLAVIFILLIIEFAFIK